MKRTVAQSVIYLLVVMSFIGTQLVACGGVVVCMNALGHQAIETAHSEKHCVDTESSHLNHGHHADSIFHDINEPVCSDAPLEWNMVYQASANSTASLYVTIPLQTASIIYTADTATPRINRCRFGFIPPPESFTSLKLVTSTVFLI